MRGDRPRVIFTGYTSVFQFGPGLSYVGTKVYPRDMVRVDLGSDRFGLLIKNPVVGVWHIAEVKSGAIIGTQNTRGAVLEQVRGDVATGDPKKMDEQVAEGRKLRRQAKLVSNEDFFRRFQRQRRKRAKTPNRPPTARQLQVLRAMRRLTEPRGPTIRELCEDLGLRSTCTVYKHILALQKRGLVAYPETLGRARNCMVTDRGAELLESLKERER